MSSQTNHTTSQPGGTTATITVKTTEGDRSIKAEIFGQWAVHMCHFEHCGFSPAAWAVTHILSGQGAGNFTARHVACNLAKRLDERYDFDAIVEAIWSGVSQDAYADIFRECSVLCRHECRVNTPPENVRRLDAARQTGGAT